MMHTLLLIVADNGEQTFLIIATRVTLNKKYIEREFSPKLFYNVRGEMKSMSD